MARRLLTLVLTARDLQRRETGRSEISAGGDALRAGGQGAVAARLAVAAMESSGGVRGGSGRVRGRRDRRPARAGSRPILSDKKIRFRRETIQFCLQIDTWQNGDLQRCSCLQVATLQSANISFFLNGSANISLSPSNKSKILDGSLFLFVSKHILITYIVTCLET
jgi:hypothetical protein